MNIEERSGALFHWGLWKTSAAHCVICPKIIAVNFIDIVVAVAIGWGLFKGFSNGVIKEIAGLLGVIVGIWAGLRLAFIFADYYRENWELPEKFVPFLAFFTAFALGLLAIFLIGRLLSKLLDAAMLGMVNKVAGAVFGGLKWALIVGSLFSILGNSAILPQETRDNSATYPYLTAYTKGVHEYSVGLIPAAKNVFAEMETYFTGIDSVQSDTLPAPSFRKNDSLQTDTVPPQP